jgi:DNA ligase (NAD+)
VVFTGTLESMPRSEAASAVKALGAKVTGTISRSTSLLVAGEGGGSKLTKAQTLGVAIMDEDAFLSRIGRGSGE